MNNDITIDQVENMASEIIGMAIDLKLIKRPATFRKRFKVNEIRSEGCSGGSSKKNGPHINVGCEWRGLSKERLIAVIEYAFFDGCRIWEIARQNWVDHKGLTFVEYASFADDPEIGWFMADDIEDHCFAMVMHEVAHAIDWWNNPSNEGHHAHGSDWRVLYRALRKAFGYVRKTDGFISVNTNWE